jgi:hypothetical protein
VNLSGRIWILTYVPCHFLLIWGTAIGSHEAAEFFLRYHFWPFLSNGRKLQNNNSKQLYQVLLHGPIMYVNLTISFVEFLSIIPRRTMHLTVGWVGVAHFCRFFVSCFHAVVSEMVDYIISNICWQKLSLFLRKWIPTPPSPQSHGIIVRHVRTWNGFFASSVVTEQYGPQRWTWPWTNFLACFPAFSSHTVVNCEATATQTTPSTGSLLYS